MESGWRSKIPWPHAFNNDVVDRLDVFLGDFRDFHWIAPHHRSLDRALGPYPFVVHLRRLIIARAMVIEIDTAK